MGTTVSASLTHHQFVPLAPSLASHTCPEATGSPSGYLPGDMKNRDDEFRRRSGHLRAMSNRRSEEHIVSHPPNNQQPTIVQTGLEPPEATISTRGPSSLHQSAPFTVLSRVLPSMSDPMERETACFILRNT
jgi:hypothetical protein